MPTWPSSLPQNLELSGYTQNLGQGSIRTDMDSGPAFQRQRYSATREPVQGSITVDKKQYATFLAFYKIDIAEGSLAFNWKHPITDAEASMRFDVSKSVSITALSNQFYRLNLNLEILP